MCVCVKCLSIDLRKVLPTQVLMLSKKSGAKQMKFLTASSFPGVRTLHVEDIVLKPTHYQNLIVVGGRSIKDILARG